MQAGLCHDSVGLSQHIVQPDEGYLNTQYVKHSQCLPDTGSANAGVQGNPVYQALFPFLPLLPEFLKGVELSAGRWPREDISRLLDATINPVVNLHSLMAELETQANAAPQFYTGKSFISLLKCLL